MFGLLFLWGAGWFSTLIWVPLIVVPDSSPRDFGGVGILLQRLSVGFTLCRALARPSSGPRLVFVLLFSKGCARVVPSGVAPEVLEG
jgi:hypothetical protein